MNTDAACRQFRQFLDSSLPVLEELFSKDEGLLNDWLQANWEILVEAIVLPGGSGRLEVYGDGADCHVTSSRVAFPDAVPTHRVVVVPTDDEQFRDLGSGLDVNPASYSFWGFVHWDGKKYGVQSELNAVLLEGDQMVVIGLKDAAFSIEPVA